MYPFLKKFADPSEYSYALQYFNNDITMEQVIEYLKKESFIILIISLILQLFLIIANYFTNYNVKKITLKNEKITLNYLMINIFLLYILLYIALFMNI